MYAQSLHIIYHESEFSATESAYQDSVCAAIYTAYETPVSKPELQDKDIQDAHDSSSEYENCVMCKAACREGIMISCLINHVAIAGYSYIYS